MAGIDEVLERLVTDPEFRARLAANPVEALSGYMLYDEDLEVLAATLSEDQGASGTVERRTSKTTLAGLLAAFEGTTGAYSGFKMQDAIVSNVNPSGSPEPDDVAVGFERAAPDQPDGHEDEIEVYGVEYNMGASGGFDGKLLRAEDLTSESGAESGFKIQVETNDMNSTQQLPDDGDQQPEG
jgi:hypothetical protein